MQYVGNNEITAKYVGNTEVQKQYVGDTLIWENTPPQHDYSQDYLTFRITSSGDVKWSSTNSSSSSKTIQYSKDGGETWTSIISYPESTIQVVAGDVLLFKGTNNGYSYASIYHHFKTDVSFSIEGNIMSLISGDNFTGNTTLSEERTFQNFFQGCTGLTSAGNLVLPATTLAQYCYQYMFDGCTSLTTAPELPATTLAIYCYSYMFRGCTSLTTAPELPATTLADRCYQHMFYNCTSLTTAPELPATTLTSRCYQSMFYGCTNLNYIKCLATDISASNCTSYWVSGVGASGTFVKAAGVSWPTGNNGIPSGWTVQEIS